MEVLGLISACSLNCMVSVQKMVVAHKKMHIDFLFSNRNIYLYKSVRQFVTLTASAVPRCHSLYSTHIFQHELASKPACHTGQNIGINRTKNHSSQCSIQRHEFCPPTAADITRARMRIAGNLLQRPQKRSKFSI